MSPVDPGFDVVTGAFGFTGQYIARRLLATGRRVRTLTGHPGRRDPFGGRVEVAPFAFDDPAALAAHLAGAATLYNTYWVRFERGPVTFARAVDNSRTLIAAAARAGVRKLVHVSITNPAEDSPLPYFRGKALVERAVRESGLPYAILRPTVLFGPEDILINNIAWLLRRFPVYAVFGSGRYEVQPVYIDDVAGLAVEAAGRGDAMVLDAVGPERYAFRDLVERIRGAVGSRARVVSVPPRLGLLAARAVGLLVGDVLVTREEVRGLMAGLLVSTGPPTGRTAFSAWLAEQAATVGTRYASELGRHYA